MALLEDLRHMVYNGPGGATIICGDKEFTALFDNSPEFYSEADGRLIMGSPQLVCYPPDVVGMRNGTPLTVDGVKYTVDMVAPDANGPTVLQITRG